MENKDVSNIDGYNTKILKDLSVNTVSTNPDDFIDILNTLSDALGGVTNLGVFCDIQKVEQKSAILAHVGEQFIHVETENAEQPYNNLSNDGSSTEPYDFNFDYLLNK